MGSFENLDFFLLKYFDTFAEGKFVLIPNSIF